MYIWKKVDGINIINLFGSKNDYNMVKVPRLHEDTGFNINVFKTPVRRCR